MKKTKCDKCQHQVKNPRSLDDCPVRCWDCIKINDGKTVKTLFEPIKKESPCKG